MTTTMTTTTPQTSAAREAGVPQGAQARIVSMNERNVLIADCGSKAIVSMTIMSIRIHRGARSTRSVFLLAKIINMPTTRIMSVALCPAANPFMRNIRITQIKRLWIMSGPNTRIVDRHDRRVVWRESLQSGMYSQPTLQSFQSRSWRLACSSPHFSKELEANN